MLEQAENPRARKASMAALLLVITTVTLTLATQTSIGTIPRWSISVVSGILSAAVVYALVDRRTRG